MATLRDAGVRRASALFVSAALGVCAALLGCAAGGPGVGERYPEKKRPDALRSASDGDVMGADEISAEDRLEASPTNEHGAARSPHAEEPAEEAHERLDYEQCLEAARAAETATTGDKPARKPVCVPPEAP